MTTLRSRKTLFTSLLVLTVATTVVLAAEAITGVPTQQQANKMVQDGNFKEALAAFRERLASSDVPGTQLNTELPTAVQCLQRLNQMSEFDALIESTLDAHPDDWRVLASAANQFRSVEHYGYLISGEFQRGHHRGGGKVMHATLRDQVRALQLQLKALELVGADERATSEDKARTARQLAETLLQGNGGNAGWRLQMLTDLETLPDYEEGWGYYGGNQGAPVNEDNTPVFHNLPESWDAATSDGERWRWALYRMVKFDANTKWDELTIRGDFLRSQFGVQTLGGMLQPLIARAEASGEQSVYSLHTLEDTETLARLATGVQRFTLPDEHNFIKLYQQAILIGSPKEQDPKPHVYEAAIRLAGLYADRRQYPKAAVNWELALEMAPQDHNRQWVQEQIDQIKKPWGQFEPTQLQASEAASKFEFRHRNATQVEFTAHAIKVRELLDDVKAYLKSKPRELDWQKVQIDNIGNRLVHENQQKYLGEQVAQWKLELKARENHFDSRESVTAPLNKAGAYLITAKVADGNISKMVMWVADTAIVSKKLATETQYFVADANNGQPIEKANIELFGYRLNRPKPNETQIDIKQSAEFTDANGLAMVPIDSDPQASRYQWLVIATTPSGRMAYLGFDRIWVNQRNQSQYDRVNAFAVTDRPVYRPGQTVKFKIWVGRSNYEAPMQSEFAHKSFQLEMHNPRGERVVNKQVTANAFGGIAGEFELETGATLGQYRFQLVNYGGGTFRVEEYKKPEFEVTVDAPSEPLALGDTFEATIAAKYYFGEPVREGTVKYKVTRTSRDTQWFPVGRWDWLYGRGYWWFGYDYEWYPGWNEWGCRMPAPWWGWNRPQPPEVVAEGEAPLDEEGKLKITIDSALAKELHPDQDHDYRIEAEVVDQSRRTITGSGSVLVARKPFEVFAWTDRGYYHTGDTVTARFQARQPDGTPVEGKGKLRLLSIAYDAEGKPTETEVRSWEVDTNGQGTAELQIKASDAGQYRLSYEVTTGEKTMQGGYLFTIVGDGFDGSDFRFADLELVPDKRHYAPGEKLQLQINTNRINSLVLLYVRPENGVYSAPQVVRLKGKSNTVPIDIAVADMPNFFVEAVTISNGKVHTVVKQVVVPPAERVVNVEVAPSSSAYQPGQEAKVKIRLTDEEGNPVVGDTVLTVYDQALDYISGGSNVGDIRKVFWGWKRNHRPQTEHNLDRYSYNLVPPGQKGMASLGMYGNLIDDQSLALVADEVAPYSFGLKTRSAVAGVPMSAAAPMARGGEVAEMDMLMEAPAAAEPASGSLEVAQRQSSAAAIVEPTVRKQFADTAYWAASVETDSAGLAEVTFPMPENLTNWKFGVWSLAHGARVGDGAATAVTRKNLLVRLQTPRFLVERDEVILSANVHNYLATDKQATVRLEVDGDYFEMPRNLEMLIEVPAGGEQRVDWRLKAKKDGVAVIRAIALTDEESDAMQLEVPIKVHGIEKLIPHSGVLASDEAVQQFEIVVPSDRRVADTRLEVQFSPTLAGAMVDALPYLIDYPYGCTEQTLNRFLPAVLTQKTLREMGVDLKAIRDKQTNLNPQELGDASERAAGWKRYEANPVFDQAELDKVVKAGVNRLTEMQLSDGGWGWFSGYGEHSSAHTSATVVRGLLVAQENDVALVPGVLERGLAWLVQYQQNELEKLANCDDEGNPRDKDKPYKHQPDNLDALVYFVLTDAQRKNAAQVSAEQMTKMRSELYEHRTKLAVYSQAMFGLALQYEVDMEHAGVSKLRDMVIRNLTQYVKHDDENQTAWLDLPGGYWWHWYGSEYEAQAYYLKLLVATDPKSDVAPRLVKYLLNNRKHATYWNSTRDTSLVVEAMANYLKATGEGQGEMTVEVWLNGQRQKTVEITPAVLFTFDNKFVIEGNDLEAGRHTLEIRKTGEGRLYYNAYLSLFSLEDDIQAAGLELKVDRKYYKLTPVDAKANVSGGRGQVVSQKVEKYERTEIPNLGEVTSGDLVEIELTVESKNDYEYILLEDLKAAGFEPMEVRSGYNGNELGAYMELRDDRISLFVQRLMRGTHSVSYRMRAETPGVFSALPTKASAMYAPELKANSNEIKVRVNDKP
ncbi:alpha-2-macroglobulin family protein [Aeoliella mucimassa]|nr:MG2 domain-containing protein [Aeoliella mucimassa]